MELLASHKYPIQSLALSNKSQTFMKAHRFKNLNLTMLQELRLQDVTRPEIRMILDSLLRSNCSKINLDICNVVDLPVIFGHKMAQRIIEMRIWLGQLMPFL
jgi:hypothetical protein